MRTHLIGNKNLYEYNRFSINKKWPSLLHMVTFIQTQLSDTKTFTPVIEEQLEKLYIPITFLTNWFVLVKRGNTLLLFCQNWEE